jgi:hypothetical protein
MSRRRRRCPRRRTALAISIVSVVGLTGCGESGDGVASTTASSTPASTTSTAASATTATPDTTAPTPTTGTLDRTWLGSLWTPSAGGGAVVNGEPTGLTSITGICQGADCAFGLDLLTDSPTGATPAPGPYLLWSSQLVGRNADGTPNWQVADQESLTLAAGEAPALCSRVDDPATTALGIISTGSTGPTAVMPAGVWTVRADGSLTTPAPSDYRCELGDD